MHPTSSSETTYPFMTPVYHRIYRVSIHRICRTAWQTQRLYLHDAITEKELDIRGTEHLKTHRGSDTTNSELYTTDILRNALNVKSGQLSTGRSIGEWRENVKPKHSKDTQNGWYRYETQFAVPVLNAKKAIDHYTVYGGTLLIRNDADGRSYLYDLLDVQKKKVISSTPFSAARRSGVFEPKPSANSILTSDGNVNTEKFSTARPTHIKRACGIASQTLLLYMYDAVLCRRLTSRRRCRSDRPCCRCSGPDSRRWYSAPPPWARPRPRSRSGASPWCHRHT